MRQPLYETIAVLCDTLKRNQESGNEKWATIHDDLLDQIEREFLPSGSGFDSGTTLDRDESGSEKIVLHTSFHHMDENGYYDGWTEHRITIWPALAHNFRVVVHGRDRNGIKDYIAECVDYLLRQVVERTADGIERVSQ